LGGFSERQTPSLEARAMPKLTKLLHKPLAFSITKKPDFQACLRCKASPPTNALINQTALTLETCLDPRSAFATRNRFDQPARTKPKPFTNEPNFALQPCPDEPISQPKRKPLPK